MKIAWQTFASGTGAPRGKEYSYAFYTGGLNGREMYTVDPIGSDQGRFRYWRVMYFGPRAWQKLIETRDVREAKRVAQEHYDHIGVNPRRTASAFLADHARAIGKRAAKAVGRRVHAAAARGLESARVRYLSNPAFKHRGKVKSHSWEDMNAGERSVKYHDTTIATLHSDGKVTLDSGGWLTATTKKRMIQAMENWGLSIQVNQVKGEWYVRNYETGKQFKFFDRVTFDPQTMTGGANKFGFETGPTYRNPSSTSTRTEVRSPTRTSTKAYTRGNVTVTGGAGAGNTSVTLRRNPHKRQLSLNQFIELRGVTTGRVYARFAAAWTPLKDIRSAAKYLAQKHGEAISAHKKSR